MTCRIVTEKGRVTRGSRSGNPVSVLQNKREMEQGNLQNPGSPQVTRSPHQDGLEDIGTNVGPAWEMEPFRKPSLSWAVVPTPHPPALWKPRE